MKQTYDCAPTLTDSQVLDFCKTGYILLESVVPDEINRRTVDYIEEHLHSFPVQHEPTEMFELDWFWDNVILNPAAIGAVRSLLGKDFGLPILLSNHRTETPSPAQGWHRDGGATHSVELHTLNVFYIPQDPPVELGPTELLPGSHFVYTLATLMGHYASIRGSVFGAAPAGSILINVYELWHRRGRATAKGVRNLPKYSYWRTVPPQRDWVVEPDFDPGDNSMYRLDGPTFRPGFHDSYDAAEMFFWLAGWQDKFRNTGGQGWPMPAHFDDTQYGYPFEQRPFPKYEPNKADPRP